MRKVKEKYDSHFDHIEFIMWCASFQMQNQRLEAFFLKLCSLRIELKFFLLNIV